jgi:hypothetical protein
MPKRSLREQLHSVARYSTLSLSLSLSLSCSASSLLVDRWVFVLGGASSDVGVLNNSMITVSDQSQELEVTITVAHTCAISSPLLVIGCKGIWLMEILSRVQW